MLIIKTDDVRQFQTISTADFEALCEGAINHCIIGLKSTSKSYAVTFKSENVFFNIIACLYMNSARSNMSPESFSNELNETTLTEDYKSILSKQYGIHHQKLRKSLVAVDPSYLNKFHSLDWRLDAIISSRSLTNQVDPRITIRLTTINEDGNKEDTTLQTDPASLVHITKVLEAALQEVRSASHKKMLHTLKRA